MTHQLRTIFASIAALQSVEKEILSKIFDDSLAARVSDVIDNTVIAFQTVENKLIKGESADFMTLQLALTAMNSDLIRFRDTHTTRKFNLEDVENFFVFFYRLRSIGEAIIAMA